MIQRTEMTAEGKAALEAEYQRLSEQEEPELVVRLSEAASQGDLRENYAYHEIRRELGMVRGRISELKNILAGAVVVAAPKADGKVRVGSLVVVKEDGTDDEEHYKIVSEAEGSNLTGGEGPSNISDSSPMGSALVGKKAGQKAVVKTPRGLELTFVIVRVE